MKRIAPLFPLAFLLLTGASPGAVGFRYFEGTAATVNKEVLFFSDVLLEQCLLRCGALPGSRAEELSLGEARERLIGDTLALQEHEKLALGQVDNAALAEQVRGALSRVASCDSPCREAVSPAQIAEWVERKLVVRDFLRRRVGAFIEVSDEDVRREIERRTGSREAANLSEEKVRQDLLDEKIDREVRNWYTRAASKSTITLTPLEGK